MNNQNIVQPALYHGLIWEPRACYKQGETKKKLFTYNKSLEHLVKRGYERHPYPSEAFSLLIDHLEEILPSDLEAIANDMLSLHGEWFNMAIERRKDVLILSRDPKNLRWKKGEYVLDGETLQCTDQKEFQIGNLPSQEPIDLKDVPEELAVFLYSKPFDQLPEAMREGDLGANIRLPPGNVIRPVCRGGFYVGFSVYYFFVNIGASRGVRQASAANNSEIE